jgi:AcrR family transcriptional regulator
MTHANIYRHFESKSALFDAITQIWLKPLEARLGEITDAPDPARDKLERLIFALFRAYHDRLDTNPQLFDLFVRAFRENRTLARQHRARIRTLIDRILEEGMSTGAFSFRNRSQAMSLTLDALYRFVQPEVVFLDKEIQRKTLESRLSATTSMLIKALSDRTI